MAIAPVWICRPKSRKLLESIKGIGKPLVVVLLSGSGLAVNWLQANADAIMQAWYPGEEGGTAVAETLAGRNNPAGRLPITFYKGLEALPDFTDYSMKNRTYRYFTGPVLYPFGFGLSYSTFRYDDLQLSSATLAAGKPLTVQVRVTNTSQRDGDEVAQLYLQFGGAAGAPGRALRAFQRLHLQAGESRTLHFTLPARQLSHVKDAGQVVVSAGHYELSVGSGQPQVTAECDQRIVERPGRINDCQTDEHHCHRRVHAGADPRRGSLALGVCRRHFQYCRVLNPAGVPTAYMTALGADIFSQDMRAEWQADGLDTSLVLTDASRLPGLYAVRNDADGERHFYYWRERSAARRLFRLPGIETAVARARSARQLYLSGITLSLFNHAERRQLNEIAAAVRAAQGQVIFDPNYRPNGWNSAEEARAAIRALAPHVSLVMPTFTDEAALFGDASPAHTVVRWRDWGAEQVIVKLGAQGCLVADVGGTTSVPAVKVTTVIDTTGAGDAFNAGFLAARCAGRSAAQAAGVANRLASLVIQHRGAIVPRERTGELRACVSAGE